MSNARKRIWIVGNPNPEDGYAVYGTEPHQHKEPIIACCPECEQPLSDEVHEEWWWEPDALYPNHGPAPGECWEYRLVEEREHGD